MPPSSSAPTTVQNEAIRQYLIDKKVAPLLETFMADLVSERPDDVLAYLKQWALEKVARRDGEQDAKNEAVASTSSVDKDSQKSNKSGGAKADVHALDDVEETPSLVPDASSAQDVEVRDPLEVVVSSWTSLVQSRSLTPAVMSKFFQMIFIQKPMFRRTVFSEITDVNETSNKIASVMDRLFTNAIPDAELVEICLNYAVGKELQEKHFASFLTAMHGAVGSTMGAEEWTQQRNLAWNFFLRELSIRIQTAVKTAEEVTAMQGGAAADEDKELSISANPNEETADRELTPATSDDEGENEKSSRSLKPDEAKEGVKQSWSKLSDATQQQVATTMIRLMLTQHPILRKTVLEGFTEEQLVSIASLYLTQVGTGAFAPETIVKTTTLSAFAEEQGVAQKHLDYVLTATLGALSAHLGKEWDAVVAVAWRDTLADHSRALDRLLFGEGAEAPNNRREIPQTEEEL